MLLNPHDRIDLVVTMPDVHRVTLFPGQETPIPSYVRLWDDVTLTYTVPFVSIFSSLTDDENMTDDDGAGSHAGAHDRDDREESQARDDWLLAATQQSDEMQPSH